MFISSFISKSSIFFFTQSPSSCLHHLPDTLYKMASSGTTQPTDLVNPGQGANQRCADWEFNDPRRIQLIQTIEGLVPNHNWPREVWACFWLSDVEMLEELVEGFKHSSIALQIAGIETFVEKGEVAKKCSSSVFKSMKLYSLIC